MAKDKNTRKLVYLIETMGMEKVISQLGKTNKGIKNTRSEIDRANKGIGGFAKNSTSAFAKQSQGLGGLVHVYATVAANIFALSAAFLVLKRNADLQILERSAETLSKSTGTNYLDVAKNMKRISNGALTIADSMRQANLALASGLSTSQLEDITQVAVKAAAATGRSVEESVQRMVQAVVKGEPELVDEFGIILRVGKATEDYALAHGKAASALTTFERQQAIATQAIERGQKAYKDIKLDDVVNPFQQLQTALIEISHTLTSMISGPLAGLASFLKDNTGILLAGIALFVRFIVKAAIPSVNDFYSNLIKKNKDAAKHYRKMSVAAQRNLNDINEAYGNITVSQNSLAKTFKNATGFAKDTEIAEAIQGKKGNKAILNSVVREFRGRFKGDVIKIIDQLDNTTNKTIKSAIGNLSRKQATAVLQTLSKYEEFQGQRLDGVLLKESQAHAKAAGARVKLHKAGLDKKLANYKRYIAESFALGAEAQRAEGIGAVGGVAAKQKKSAAKAQKGLLGSVASISTKFGGVFSLVSNIAGKLFGWGIAFTIVASIMGPLLGSLGLWNSELSGALDKLEEIKGTNDEIDEQTFDIREQLTDVNSSHDQTIRALNIQLSIAAKLKQNFKQIVETSKQISESSGIRNWWNDSDENRIKGIVDQIENMKKIGIVFDPKEVIKFQSIMKKFAGKDNINVFGTKGNESLRKTIDVTTILEFAFDATGDAAAQLTEYIGKLTDAQKHDLSVEFAEKYSKVITTFEEAANATKAAIKGIEGSFTTLSDTFAKDTSGISGGGPFVEYAKQLESVRKNLDSVKNDTIDGISVTERLEKALSVLSPAFKKAYDIDSLSRLKEVTDEILAQQHAYFINSKAIATAEQHLKVQNIQVQRGSEAAIERQFAIQKSINGLKMVQLQLEITALEVRQQSLDVDSEGYKNLKASLDLLKAKKGAIASENDLLYNDQRKALALIDVQQKKSILNIEKQTELLKTQSDILNYIAKDKSKSSDERGAAIQQKEFNDILVQQSKINKASANIAFIDKKIVQLKREQGDNTLEILKAEKQRVIISRELSLNEYKIKDIRQKALTETLRMNEEGLKFDIEALNAKLEMLKKVSNISQSIANDDRYSSDKRLEALKKSNAILTDAFSMEKKLSKLRSDLAQKQLKVLKDAEEIADPSEILKYEIQLQTEKTLQLGLQAEEMKRQLDYAEKSFELAKKRTKLNDFFDNPDGTMKLIRKEFALSAAEFAESVQNPIDRLVDTIEATIDNTVDSFVDAIVEGENVLKATTDAIVNTLNEAAINYTKDILKQMARDLIVKITGDENYGKSAEEILLEQNNTAAEKSNQLLQQIANNTAGTNGIMNQASSAAGGIIGAFGSPLKAKPGSQEEFDIFDKVPFEDISAEGIKIVQSSNEAVETMTTGVTGILGKLAGGFMGLGGELAAMATQAIQSMLFSGGSGGGGGLGGMIGGLFSGGSGIASTISGTMDNFGSLLMAANGGVFNELKSIKAYANGGMTAGPELALIGEGQNREAVVPLPDNRSIPVDLGNEKSGGDNIVINVNVSNVQGTEQGLKRSANQIGMQVSRALQQANRRNG